MLSNTQINALGYSRKNKSSMEHVVSDNSELHLRLCELAHRNKPSHLSVSSLAPHTHNAF